VPDELAFEAADCFAACFAFLLFAFQVGACGWVDAALGDRDPVQRAVELAVAAAVEAVALVFAGARIQRCDAGVAGELRVGCEAVDRSDLAEQLGGTERSATGQLKQPGCERLGACLQLAVELADRVRQRAAAARPLNNLAIDWAAALSDDTTNLVDRDSSQRVLVYVHPNNDH
jgi:hypothetical protein